MFILLPGAKFILGLFNSMVCALASYIRRRIASRVDILNRLVVLRLHCLPSSTTNGVFLLLSAKYFLYVYFCVVCALAIQPLGHIRMGNAKIYIKISGNRAGCPEFVDVCLQHQ